MVNIGDRLKEERERLRSRLEKILDKLDRLKIA